MKVIKGKNAVVTGSANGIGRSIALALAKEGANIVVADINLEGAKAVADEIAKMGVGSLAVKVDVSDFESVKNLEQTAVDAFGPVGILCNNAGVTLRPHRASWDTSLEDYKFLFDINWYGVLHGHLAFLPGMIKSPGEKHIVNTSSMNAWYSLPGYAAYSATKGAIQLFSDVSREELKIYDIGLTSLCPGTVRTNNITTAASIMKEEQKERQSKVKKWTDYSPTGTWDYYPYNVLITDFDHDPDVAKGQERITPRYVGQYVVEAIYKNKPYVTTHQLRTEALKEKWDAFLDAVPTFPEH